MVDVLGTLNELSAGLRLRAGALRAAAGAAEQAVVSSGWTGHRADLVLDSVRQQRQEAESIAHALDQLAQRADNMHSDLGTALRLMHRYEDNVRSWLGRATPEQLQHFTVGGHLPTAGSHEWAHVMTLARNAGAAL